MTIKNKALKALRNPAHIPYAIKNRISHFYKLHIIKDEFTVAVTKWFRDRGDETLRLDYPLTSQSVIFDLGGYKGDFAYEINKKYGCFIYVFEPVRDFYEECAERFKGNHKVRVFNYGLSDQTTTAYISDEDDGSSVIKNNTENCERIILKRFQDEFQRLQVDAIDLLKVNVEGAEFLIIPHLIQSGVIKKVKHLQVQFHTFYPNAESLRRNIRQELGHTHTEKWNYPFVWESWSRF
jgi:FkbM family methyltransferase